MTPRRRLLERALARAGAVLTRHFGKVKAQYKGPADLLTQADTDSQAAVLELITRAFPEDDYLAEEKASKLTGAEHLWIIDPLDGTTNYAHGFPMACTSIGILRRGRPYLGGVNDPFRGERFLAESGKGAFLNGSPMRVSSTRPVSRSLLITGFPYDRQKRSHFYIEYYRSMMTRCHDIRRTGTAALDLAWVAAGRADGFWEWSLNPWDVAAGWLLVSEAGGRVTDFAGRPWSYPDRLGTQTLATNGRIHREMIAVLSEIKP